MPLEISTDIQQRVEAQLATGAFQSEEEVLREAMDSLERRQRDLAELQAMVREAEEDVAAGRVGPFNVAETMARIYKRLSPSEIAG